MAVTQQTPYRFHLADLPSHLLIRPMALDDLEQVQAIDRLSFSLPWPLSSYRFELLNNPASLLWVAEIGGSQVERHVVGSIVVWLILDEAHIATLAVHPDYRRKGISRALLAVALQESIRKGARRCTLEVRAGNAIAQALYRQFGFEVVGIRHRYYRDNEEDALIMAVNDLGPEYLEWLESGRWSTGQRYRI